jgi:hypothetical protein
VEFLIIIYDYYQKINFAMMKIEKIESYLGTGVCLQTQNNNYGKLNYSRKPRTKIQDQNDAPRTSNDETANRCIGNANV